MDFLRGFWYYLCTMYPGDLQFLHYAHMSACTARVDKRFAGYHTLQFVESGSVELFYGDTRHLLVPGTFWTTFPGVRIRFHAAPDIASWNHRYVAFTGAVVARWIADGLWFTHPQSSDASTMATRFDALLIAVNAATTRFSHAHAAHSLEGILIQLAQERERGAVAAHTAPEWLALLLAQMEKPDFDAARWASAQGISLATVRRSFKAATGSPLHESLLRLRLARARALLADTGLPVKVIAEQLGYSDIYFFTRQFRRFVGIPPAAFRRSHR